jgi:hypothetical protein
MDEVSGGGYGHVGGACGWHGDLSEKPREHVGNAFGLGLKYPDAVATIIVQGRAEVPAINGMGHLEWRAFHA